MAAFIKKCLLENRTTQDILQIMDFRYIAWKFLLAIYESGWDKLMANKENMSFRQYVSAQFNKTSSNK